jgi:hypothetical protein
VKAWRIVVILVVLGIALIWRLTEVPDGPLPAPADRPAEPAAAELEVDRAYRERRSGLEIEVAGTVRRLLADDEEGTRHQRFIVELSSGHTLLVSHNIDLAQRVPIERGDRVELRGRYEWNERGGVVHWTHHDPQGRRPGGWIRHEGATYR